ncbi:MAG: hypothetical protein Tsb005_13290 [Gammaproteobacteria bacterium]
MPFKTNIVNYQDLIELKEKTSNHYMGAVAFVSVGSQVANCLDDLEKFIFSIVFYSCAYRGELSTGTSGINNNFSNYAYHSGLTIYYSDGKLSDINQQLKSTDAQTKQGIPRAITQFESNMNSVAPAVNKMLHLFSLFEEVYEAEKNTAIDFTAENIEKIAVLIGAARRNPSALDKFTHAKAYQEAFKIFKALRQDELQELRKEVQNNLKLDYYGMICTNLNKPSLTPKNQDTSSTSNLLELCQTIGFSTITKDLEANKIEEKDSDYERYLQFLKEIFDSDLAELNNAFGEIQHNNKTSESESTDELENKLEERLARFLATIFSTLSSGKKNKKEISKFDEEIFNYRFDFILNSYRSALVKKLQKTTSTEIDVNAIADKNLALVLYIKLKEIVSKRIMDDNINFELAPKIIIELIKNYILTEYAALPYMTPRDPNGNPIQPNEIKEQTASFPVYYTAFAEIADLCKELLVSEKFEKFNKVKEQNPHLRNIAFYGKRIVIKLDETPIDAPTPLRTSRSHGNGLPHHSLPKLKKTHSISMEVFHNKQREKKIKDSTQKPTPPPSPQKDSNVNIFPVNVDTSENMDTQMKIPLSFSGNPSNETNSDKTVTNINTYDLHTEIVNHLSKINNNNSERVITDLEQLIKYLSNTATTIKTFASNSGKIHSDLNDEKKPHNTTHPHVSEPTEGNSLSSDNHPYTFFNPAISPIKTNEPDDPYKKSTTTNRRLDFGSST